MLSKLEQSGKKKEKRQGHILQCIQAWWKGSLIFFGTDLFDLLILACLACNVSRALFVSGRAGPGPSERGYVRGRTDANGLNYQSLTRFAINEAVMHECVN